MVSFYKIIHANRGHAQHIVISQLYVDSVIEKNNNK